MGVPKRRVSRSRRNKRRSHDALARPGLGRCPRCSVPALPHRLCDNCGHYAGLEVINKDEEAV